MTCEASLIARWSRGHFGTKLRVLIFAALSLKSTSYEAYSINWNIFLHCHYFGLWWQQRAKGIEQLKSAKR